jgi:cytochrome c oxidase subunit 2
MAIIDKAEQKVLIITGCLMSLFVFSILYAKGKYKSDVPECLPFDKAILHRK